MKRIGYSIFFSTLLLIVIGCAPPVPDVPTLTKVDSKTESDGLQNHMILYTVNGAFDSNEFLTLCKSLKSNPVTSGFNYIVVFDDAANAGFPTTPFSSLYGLEENRMKHIVAIYEYNAVNGFSQSVVYTPNMWTGKPIATKL